MAGKHAGFTVRPGSVDARGGAVAVRDYLPDTPRSQTALLWIHGGGFTSGGLDQHESDGPARWLAAAGRRVRTLDYRLAPKARLGKDPELGSRPTRYPAALHDVVDVARSLAVDTGGLIDLGGASAGANLAAATAITLRDDGEQLPRSLVLAYGTFHAFLPENDDVERDLRGPLAKWAFNPVMTGRMNLNYVGDRALLVPGTAFPGGADLRGVPPTLILDARNDRLRRSGHAFAGELRSAGVQVREVVAPAFHGFLGARRSRGFSLALPEIAHWLAVER